MSVLPSRAVRSMLKGKALSPVSVLLMALGATGVLAQQAPRPVINVRALGPQVGARIPDFTLVDQSGARRTPRSLMGPKGLMLVLFRSADW